MAHIPMLVVIDKQITAQDNMALNSNPGPVIHSVEKVGFNQERFIVEVRRALLTQEEAPDGQNTNH